METSNPCKAKIKITAIMASDPNGVVGVGYDLPWDFPEEFEHFKRTVKGQVMIMGRKTYEATPSDALLDAVCIVISRSENLQQKHRGHTFYKVDSIQHCLDKLAELPKDKKVFVIGGAEILNMFSEKQLIDEFILTIMHQTYDGDIVINLKPFEDWQKMVLSKHEHYTIYHLIK